jgi:hypothetical protein
MELCPEQAQSDWERIDGRTDIFGLGAVLYQLLTHRPPYEAPDADALWRKACAGEITPFTENEQREIPSAVREFCLHCLAAAPAQRPASAAIVVEKINALLARQTPPRTSLLPWLVASAGVCAALLILLLAIGPTYLWPNRTPKPANKVKAVSPTNATPAGERPLRRDFVIQAEILGAEQPTGAAGVVMRVGDAIRLKLTADRDCYVGVWSVQPDGIVQILPNAAESSHRLIAHQPRIVPGEADVPEQAGKVLRVTPSSGNEFFHIVASTQPLPRAQGQPLGPYVVIPEQTRSGPWQFTLRGVELIDESALGSAQLIAELIVPYEAREP